MAQIAQLIRMKDKPLAYDELANLIKMGYSHLDDQDLYGLLQAFLSKQKETFSIEQSLGIVEIIRRQVQKLQPRQFELATFYFNSIMMRAEDSIVKVNLDIRNEVDVNRDFKDILGQDFYRKLINFASSGLLNAKLQQKPHRRYKFFQWVQNTLQLCINEDSKSDLYGNLLKQVWSFKFEQSLSTINKIKISYPDDSQVSSAQAGLRIYAEMMAQIVQNEELKQVFIDRKEFEIKFQSDFGNKLEQKDFNLKINEIKQQLLFGSNYFMALKGTFVNQHYKAMAQFLGNREDNYRKKQDVVILLSQISIIDRFFYAKMFFIGQDFDSIFKILLQSQLYICSLDYILLYGTSRQSEQILQNYLDQTNELQKVAIISVFLKIFQEQGKLAFKDKVDFNRFLKHYEFMLVCMDSGISKHKFDQKCITVQVQRKKKTMNKTFSFNCIHCKASQCLLSITKRIATDSKQHQVRMKGNNAFSKDRRNQLMYCLDCMELLPKCAVCLFQITVFNGYAEDLSKSSTGKHVNSGQALHNALVWCPKCYHGGHFTHIMKWLQLSKKCPVFSCKCRCSI